MRKRTCLSFEAFRRSRKSCRAEAFSGVWCTYVSLVANRYAKLGLGVPRAETTKCNSNQDVDDWTISVLNTM